jgi:hypothetical protein
MSLSNTISSLSLKIVAFASDMMYEQDRSISKILRSLHFMSCLKAVAGNEDRALPALMVAML